MRLWGQVEMTQPGGSESGGLQGLSTDPEILQLQQQVQQIDAEQQAYLAQQQGEVPTQAEFGALQAQVNATFAAVQQQMQSIVGGQSNAAAP